MHVVLAFSITPSPTVTEAINESFVGFARTETIKQHALERKRKREREREREITITTVNLNNSKLIC